MIIFDQATCRDLSTALKVHGTDEATRKTVKAWLAEFGEHFNQAGLEQASEIFDGDAPLGPRGCIAQAWSVAELLRVAVALANLDQPVPAAEARRPSPEAPAVKRQVS
jgi:glycogen debranching enzyme